MVFAESDRTITLIHNSNELIGKETLANATAEGLSIRNIDLAKESLTRTQWAEIADHTNVPVTDLINKEHPNYLSKFEKDVKLEREGALTLLEQNPDILQKPIAIKGNQFKIIQTPKDIFHLNSNN